ncbi:MAG: efflux RND transporter periplasmic adaptor subunit [Bacteroidales bacterium]|jgi:membrane fusion protein (multidrug efflux system)|nr:efflux RND transporter periplasmic adaptor subunit [Bacteroidales bacterium]
MNKKVKIISLIVIGVLILGIVLYPTVKEHFFNPLNKSPLSAGIFSAGSKPLSVNAMVLNHSTLEDVFRTKGILIPDEEVSLSFETTGKITYIYFKEGSFVKKGELLAKMNDKPLQAELKKLEAQIPLAQDRVARQKSLLEKDAVSQESYESVVTDLDKLNADIELVKARIEQTELRAPFDGQIGLRMVSEGTFASLTTIVSTLTKLTPLKIEFSVNERQAEDIKQGTALDFTVGNDMLTQYKATVYAVESRLDEQTLSLKARAIYPNTRGELKPGHSVDIAIKLQEYGNALVVPAIAVIAELGRDIVYLHKDGKAQRAVIKKGMRTASSVQVLSGLNYGDTLITSGVMQLRDGMTVVLNNLQ